MLLVFEFEPGFFELCFLFEVNLFETLNQLFHLFFFEFKAIEEFFGLSSQVGLRLFVHHTFDGFELVGLAFVKGVISGFPLFDLKDQLVVPGFFQLVLLVGREVHSHVTLFDFLQFVKN